MRTSPICKAGRGSIIKNQWPSGLTRLPGMCDSLEVSGSIPLRHSSRKIKNKKAKGLSDGVVGFTQKGEIHFCFFSRKNLLSL